MPLGEVHVLVIDDDDTSLEVMEALLDQVGASYTFLDSVDASADNLRSLGQIDVIFLDLEMPRRNGYDVLHEITAAFGGNVPVVAYTAHTSEMVHARESGFHSFLGKPLNGAKFADQLNRILNGQQIWSRSG